MKPGNQNIYKGSFFVNDHEWDEKTKGFSKNVKKLLDKIRLEVKEAKKLAS
ncbi:MAG: hypothetical protein HRU09_17680 [Oligoflexales bacterium]|nr:hypothetical protein [Oligoflexales bacterium]